MTDSEYVHVVTNTFVTHFPKQRQPGGFPAYRYKSKADRISDHLSEFTDAELEEMLSSGHTIYPAESPVDTDTDIADQIQEELDDRRHQRRCTVRHNLIRCKKIQRLNRERSATTHNAREAARVYAIKRGIKAKQWGAFS